jgi:hypothetical protein
MNVSDIASFVVLGYMGSRLVAGTRRSRTEEGRRLAGDIVRGIRWRHFLPVPFMLAAIIGVASLVMLIPGMSWGWWTALGGTGNPVFGSSASTAGSALEWLIPLIFIVLLLPALPLFAHAEERMFRAGAESWSVRTRVLKAVQFGIIHAAVGIPIGAAMALSVGGGCFIWWYLREFRRTGSRRLATIESARLHTAYNAVIVVAVVVALA